MGTKLKFNGAFPVHITEKNQQNQESQSKIQIPWDYRNWKKIQIGKLNTFK